MTPDQITAILSLLFAFGVPQITIDQIRVEITPVAATSTPVMIAPIIAPTFGSVNNSPPTQTEVVQSPVMDQSGIFLTDLTEKYADTPFYRTHPNYRYINIAVRDADGTVVINTKETVDISVDGQVVDPGRELNGIGGIQFGYDFVSHESSVDITYKGVVHTFALNSL